jgi:hypothetical protein
MIKIGIIIINWLAKLAKNFLIKYVDANNDGVIDSDELLDFAKAIIEKYEEQFNVEVEFEYDK